jgi:hypothetical protein
MDSGSSPIRHATRESNRRRAPAGRGSPVRPAVCEPAGLRPASARPRATPATLRCLSRLITRQQIRSGASARFCLEIDIGQRLPVVIPDDEAASIVLFDVPWRREATGLLYRHVTPSSCKTIFSSMQFDVRLDRWPDHKICRVRVHQPETIVLSTTPVAVQIFHAPKRKRSHLLARP